MNQHDRGATAIWLLALAALGSCAGVQTVTKHHENGHVASIGGHAGGLRNGPWADYYADGQKQCEGTYVDDMQSGLWTYWYENGTKEMEGHFADERRDGEWKSWYENGALRSEGRFERGFETGLWRFHASTGVLERTGGFELGQPVLRWTYFHPDGSVRATGNFHAGVRVGEWTTREVAGTNDVLAYLFPAGCELVEEHFPDSTLKRAGFLREGVPVGRWNSHHAGGALRLECNFRDGEPDGRACAWREDGTLLASGSLKEGRVFGKWVFSHGLTQETNDFEVARPRQPFGGEWSPASSAAELPGCTVVETWVAELCSPRQPAPILSASSPARSTPIEPLGKGEESGMAARARPWTEYETTVLPELVKMYGPGAPDGPRDEYWTKPVLRGSHSKRDVPVASAADLVGRTLPVNRFATADGGEIDLDEFGGKRNVLVTILRGFGGQVCVYCAAQTKGLADFAGDFAALDTEVLVVFPGPASGLDAFLDAYRRTFGADAKPPYKLLYDTDLALTRALRIEDNIAVPTSIVLDRSGIVRWCHVAKNHADRPSAKQVLEKIEALPKDEP